MALALNTSHDLYPYLAALICVDDDNVVKDLTGNRTCTKDASVAISSGTYGRHFTTTVVSNNALGVALSPGITPKPIADPQGTTLVVINSGHSRTSRGGVFNNAATHGVGPGVYTGDAVGISSASGYPGQLGTTDVIGTGAHAFAVGYSGVSGELGYIVYVDGGVENSGSTNVGNAGDTIINTYIGGAPTGGYGGFAASYVWIAHFTKILTEAELDDLYSSLGAGNAFALIASSGATTHATTGELASQSASVDGTSSRTGNHAASGALAATAAIIAGASARSGSFVTHAASGDLVSTPSVITSSASRSSASVTHATTGSVAASAASVVATASRSAAGQITTDILANNTMTPLANTAVVWSWLPIGRIGSLSAITPIDGTGTTGSDGRLTVSGLTAGAGILLVAKQNSGATDDDVFYQAGTVA